MKVLIVDDSELVCNRLRAMLLEQGSVEVEEANHTGQAIEALRLGLPEVVILDLILPDGASFQLIRFAKSVDPGITVIVLTNYAFSSYRRLALESGADYFFDKSSEFDQAFAIVQRLTDGGTN
jgi:DNA-binding NarL/FixJ family response regulator